MKSTMRFHLSDLLQKQPPELFCKKGVLRNFAKFAGKHLCQSFCFKVAGRVKTYSSVPWTQDINWTFGTSAERLMYVQFTFCVQGGYIFITNPTTCNMFKCLMVISCILSLQRSYVQIFQEPHFLIFCKISMPCIYLNKF